MADPEEPTPDKQVMHKLGAYPAIYKFYEDGKARRYNMLFAVNTAMFGILKLLPDLKMQALPGLEIAQVANGMALFTVVMGFDIWMFGTRMREAGQDGCRVERGMFSLPGKLVLVLICGLITLGWVKVAGGAVGVP